MSKRRVAEEKKRREPKVPAKAVAGAEVLPVLAPSDGEDDRRRVSVSTVGDLGHFLPVGVLQGGQLHRGFAFKRWTTREERWIERFKAEHKGLTAADLVTAALAHFLTGLGPFSDFQALGEAERRLIVSQLWLPDVIFALIQLRISALGEEIAFDLRCPACDHRWRYGVDLRRTDVVVAEDVSALTWRYDLRDPLPTAKGDVDYLVLQPARWFALVGVGADADVKARIAAASIRRMGDHEDLVPTPDILDDLGKYDLEHITAEVDENTPGADLELAVVCPKARCRHEFRHAIVPMNWDFFFGASSL